MAHKIIQIEGPDGAGKSYLASRILEKTKAAYIHVSNYPNKAQTMLQHNPMMDFGEEWAHRRDLSPVVLDRHWLTLFVYTMVFDNQSDQVRVINFLADNLHVWKDRADKIVICLPPKGKYLERFEKLKNERQELYKDMGQIYDAFWALYNGKVLDNPVCNTLLGRHLMSGGGLKNWPNVVLYDYTEHFVDLGLELGLESNEVDDWVDTNILK